MLLRKKLELLQVHADPFTWLAARKMEFPDLYSTNNAASVQMMHDEFTSRFPEVRGG